MILLADEGIDKEIVLKLRQEGHEVIYVAEMDPGASDSDILEIARNRKTLFLTSDKDFGELVFRQRQLHSGVLLLRLHGLSVKRKGALVSVVLKEHSNQLHGGFSVISPGLLRTRPGDPEAR